MVNAERLSFQGITTNSVYSRTNLVTIRNMARPYVDVPGEWKFPPQFEQLVDQVVAARAAGKPVIWSMGAHVIKNGLSRYIIELVKEGVLTHVSGNGATSIHDFELTFLGETSEDVARSIEDGSFGMWEETGRYMNEAIQQGDAAGLGYGESLYRYATAYPERFPYIDDCVFVQCQRYGVPYTCHISIGTDIIHQHPIVDFGALGGTTGRDFNQICRSIAALEHGGVYLNFGSAISGPELFMHGLALARNKGIRMEGIVAANFDIVPVTAEETPPQSDPNYHYRPRRVFVDRLSEIDGTGYLFHGLHQLTIPHFFEQVLRRKRELGIEFPTVAAGADGTRVEGPKGLGGETRLYPVRERASGLHLAGMASPGQDDAVIPQWPTEPRQSSEFAEFISRLEAAKDQQRMVVCSLGGNVIASGVNRYLIDLIARGYISHIAVNGASCFQDMELAAFGHTDELEVGALREGKFGMWREPGDIMHRALAEGDEDGLGFGDSLIEYANKHPEQFPHIEESLFGACSRYGIPYTCHITIGIDDIQLHPAADFTVLGRASGLDFQTYCHSVANLEGGAFLNFGSTVTGPEVFLKALSIARNLQYTVHHITTANFDIVRLGDYSRKVGYEDWDYYYRPRKNIIHRPTSLGGKGYHFEGLHQLTIPAIWRGISKT